MAQSKSSSLAMSDDTFVVPRRSFTIEFFVGLFSLCALFAAGYLSVGLGGLEIGTSDTYYIEAEFENISGLKTGASVEIAGVRVGEVSSISLEDPLAIVRLKMDNTVQVRDDDIVSIRTKGIIGDRYVKITRGASDMFIEADGRIVETESVVDIEDIIGKIIHQFGDDGDK